MKRCRTVPAAAVASLIAWSIALAPAGLAAQTAQPPVATPSPSQAPIAIKAPHDWIVFSDHSTTPVVDAVSAHLAAARHAIADRDDAKAAQAMRAAARALAVQGERLAALERRRAVADAKRARETHARIVALSARLEATAALIEAGKVPTTAVLDQALGEDARADLEGRWLAADAATWYPVSQEPQRHFGAAIADFARHDSRAAAVEVRKADAYLRLAAARATGGAARALDAASTGLATVAHALDHGTLKSADAMERAFADANHALALAHRARAAQAWARKAYDQAGYELEAAAFSLDSATAWAGTHAQAAARAASADARAVGHKLASGGIWAKDEVAKGFESLRTALDQLGHSIGSKVQASPFDVGA